MGLQLSSQFLMFAFFLFAANPSGTASSRLQLAPSDEQRRSVSPNATNAAASSNSAGGRSPRNPFAAWTYGSR